MMPRAFSAVDSFGFLSSDSVILRVSLEALVKRAVLEETSRYGFFNGGGGGRSVLGESAAVESTRSSGGARFPRMRSGETLIRSDGCR